MAKLIYAAIASLDGYVENEEGMYEPATRRQAKTRAEVN